MTLNVHRRRDQRRCRRVAIWLNGQLVTKECQRYDGRRHRVYLLDRNPDGHFFLTPDRTQPSGRWHIGQVKIKDLR